MKTTRHFAHALIAVSTIACHHSTRVDKLSEYLNADPASVPSDDPIGGELHAKYSLIVSNGKGSKEAIRFFVSKNAVEWLRPMLKEVKIRSRVISEFRTLDDPRIPSWLCEELRIYVHDPNAGLFKGGLGEDVTVQNVFIKTTILVLEEKLEKQLFADRAFAQRPPHKMLPDNTLPVVKEVIAKGCD